VELWKKEGAPPSQKFMIIAENTDKNTDKMAGESREGKNDEVEVVETVGCGGKI
jgi:hypothetical protein